MRAAAKRKLLLTALVGALALVGARDVALADGALPAGGVGMAGGARHGVGRMAALYNLGLVWGVQAGYQPTGLDQKWSVGGVWSVLWGRLGASDPSVNDGTLHTLEMNIAVRIRRLMSSRDPVFLTISPIGLTLLSTDLPIPPDGERRYWGPYAGVGGEMFLGEKYSLSVEARYGVFTGGPGSLTYLFCLSVGSG